MQPPFPSIIVSWGLFVVHWYGLLIVTGIVLAATTTAYLARVNGDDGDRVWDMLLIVVLAGIIGARLYHVFSQPAGGMIGWTYYKQHPIEILYIWQGGLGIYGAVLGGALGLYLYCRHEGLSPLRWMDYAAPGVALGQAIGRWGNYMNRELYGPPTDLPWGLIIPPAYRIAPYNDLSRYPPETRFHPTFLYESLAALILFFILFTLGAKHYKRLKEGDLLLGYFLGYAVIRFFTEMLRPDAWRMGALATAQVIALIVGGISLVLLLIRHWGDRSSTSASA
jgi:phosphatidylglycerol:prolipoprotein diacylglycerol transferase